MMGCTGGSLLLNPVNDTLAIPKAMPAAVPTAPHKRSFRRELLLRIAPAKARMFPRSTNSTNLDLRPTPKINSQPPGDEHQNDCKQDL